MAGVEAENGEITMENTAERNGEGGGTSTGGEVAGASGDIFEAEMFDAVAFTNRLFPDEASLDGVEPLLRSLRHRVRRVDRDILSAVRRQSHGGSKAKLDLASATKAIQELQERVIDIKLKVRGARPQTLAHSC